MTDKEKLAQIIRDNPGATLRVDNDNWCFIRPLPEDYDTWDDEKQEIWWEDESELCNNHQFPELGIEWGWGPLQVLTWMHDIELEIA